MFGRTPEMISLAAKSLDPDITDVALVINSLTVESPLPSTRLITEPTKVGRLLSINCSSSLNLCSNDIFVIFTKVSQDAFVLLKYLYRIHFSIPVMIKMEEATTIEKPHAPPSNRAV
jgi:hypothetical protein